MTAHITPTDLRMLDAEPRVQDLKLAEALEFAQPRDIRKLIERNRVELGSHGEVCATVAQTSANGGRPGNEYWLNEPQSVLLCMFSRTDKAADVRKEIIDVFLAWRKGRLLPVMTSPLTAPEDGPTAALNAKLGIIREARLVFGIERARALWPQLDLPPVPEVAGPADEARALLRHLLAQPLVFDQQDRPVRTLGDLLSGIIENDGDNWPVLTENGIRVVAESQRLGFVVANNHPKIAAWLRDTPWRAHWAPTLRRYPGAARTEPMKFAHIAHRGTFVPADALDDPAVIKPAN